MERTVQMGRLERKSRLLAISVAWEQHEKGEQAEWRGLRCFSRGWEARQSWTDRTGV